MNSSLWNVNNVSLPEGLEEQESEIKASVESNLATQMYLYTRMIKQLVKVVGCEFGNWPLRTCTNEEEAVNVAYAIRTFIRTSVPFIVKLTKAFAVIQHGFL